jgi:hypothetical protein
MVSSPKFYASVLFCAAALNAATLRVPQGYARIQEALDKANSGDTVLVSAGVYTEHLLWPVTNSIKLFSTDGSAKTILDAGGDTGSLCGIHTGVDSTTYIRGFTFKNARLDNL